MQKQRPSRTAESGNYGDRQSSQSQEPLPSAQKQVQAPMQLQHGTTKE